MTVPAIALILLVFGGILVLTRIKVPLGIAAAIGAIILDFFGRRRASLVVTDLIEAVTALQFWLLLLSVVLIIEFGRYMTTSRNSEEILALVSRLTGRYGRAWTLVLPPAVLGLVPMPGGALFSAPLVGKASEPLTIDGKDILSAEDKTVINYWFRHVWEYWWPLFPGVIVAMTIFDMDSWRFIVAQAPMSIVSIAAGLFFLIRPHYRKFPAGHATNTKVSKRSILLCMPLVLAIVSTVALHAPIAGLLPSVTGESHRLLAMLVGLGLGSAIIIADEKSQGKVLFLTSVLKPQSRNVVLSVFGILIFRHMLETSGLVLTACEEMNSMGLSPLVAVVCLPALAGLVTGIAYGFTGISFPLVVVLMKQSGLSPMSTLVLAYACGYMGMIFSPVHICLIVSKDHFQASLRKSMIKMVPCGVTVLAAAAIAYILLSRAGL